MLVSYRYVMRLKVGLAGERNKKRCTQGTGVLLSGKNHDVETGDPEALV